MLENRKESSTTSQKATKEDRVVVAGLVWHNGSFITTQRTRGSHAGQWEFPGGKVIAGESKINALSRELREELGISVEKAELWRSIAHKSGENCIVLHVYHVTQFSGEPCSMEGQNLRWVTSQEAANLPFLEADMPLVRELAGEIMAPLPGLQASFSWLMGLEPNPAV